MEPIRSEQDWQNLVDQSHKQTVILMKHSLICPISGAVFERVTKGLKEGHIPEPVHLLIVQDQPELKLKIADDLGVTHESPQIIVIKNGKAIYDASHNAITVSAVVEQLEK